MTRALWKGPFIDHNLFKNKNRKSNLKLWSRSSVIPALLVGETVLVHSGKEFKRVAITREKVGFKFGEFSFTRRYTLKQRTQKIISKSIKK
jgi:small subunit ribosomal protein S19